MFINIYIYSSRKLKHFMLLLKLFSIMFPKINKLNIQLTDIR